MTLWEAGQKRIVHEAEVESDRITVAVANGYAIATSEKARAAWERRKPRHPVPQDAASQRATLSRLAARFPNNVKAN